MTTPWSRVNDSQEEDELAASVGELIAVPFRDDTVWAFEEDGQVYVALRPIVTNLGMSWGGQHTKLQKDELFREGVLLRSTPSPGGTQETTCLALEMLHGWLFRISVKRVKPSLRAKLLTYQRECLKALNRHFHGEIATPIPGGRPSAAQVHNGIEAHLHHHQLRVLAAIKAYGETDLHEMIASTGLSLASVKRAVFLLWYLGVIDAQEEGGVMRYRVIPAEKRPYLPMPPHPKQPRRSLR